MTRHALGFLGAGHMAEAIAKAAIQRGVVRADQLIASDPSAARRAVFSGLGITATADNAQTIGLSRHVLVAVKPQAMRQAATDLAQHGHGDQVIISIMAGISTQKLGQAIAQQGAATAARIVRVMPNTPLQAGFGMTGVANGPDARPGDEQLALRLFAAAGRVVQVDESQLDAITAVSGSGPAYVFYLAEAMERAARDLGLAEHADLLVEQTILGAAHLLTATGDTPTVLRQKVTSPGGTTEAAIAYLDRHQTADVISQAIRTAAKRSVELGG